MTETQRRVVRRMPTWLVLLACIATAVACYAFLSGIVMAGSFAVAGPVEGLAARAERWRRVQRWWTVGLAISVIGFVVSSVALSRRSWRRARPVE